MNLIYKQLAWIGLILCMVACKKNIPITTINNIDTTAVSKARYDLKTVEITNENVVDFLTWYGSFNPETEIIVTTKFGDIEIELFEDTPLHRANAIYLVKKKYFDTTFFHRVVKGFVVQGGNSDEMKTSRSRKKIGYYTIPSEFRKNRTHQFGVLCSARSWDDNPEKRSIPYEFYFVHSKKGEHHLNNEHTVFGKITKGFNVLDSIANQPIDKGSYPLLNINMKVFIK